MSSGLCLKKQFWKIEISACNAVLKDKRLIWDFIK